MALPIKQIAIAQSGDADATIVALCIDGSLWWCSPFDSPSHVQIVWHQLPPIPAPKEDQP